MDIEELFMILLAPLGIFLLYIMFIFMPVHLYHETKCLEKGFPKTDTTVTLTGYCMNLEGVVTAKVEKL